MYNILFVIIAFDKNVNFLMMSSPTDQHSFFHNNGGIGLSLVTKPQANPLSLANSTKVLIHRSIEPMSYLFPRIREA